MQVCLPLSFPPPEQQRNSSSLLHSTGRISARPAREKMKIVLQKLDQRVDFIRPLELGVSSATRLGQLAFGVSAVGKLARRTTPAGHWPDSTGSSNPYAFPGLPVPLSCKMTQSWPWNISTPEPCRCSTCRSLISSGCPCGEMHPAISPCATPQPPSASSTCTWRGKLCKAIAKSLVV